MNNFIEKLGSYQIITNLLPGVFFGMALRLLLGIAVPMETLVRKLWFIILWDLSLTE